MANEVDMSIFKRIFGVGKKPNSFAFRLERAKELHGQAVKFVTERNNGNDDIIGRGGALAIHEDKFIVDSSGERIFVCYVKDLEANWLMSGNGVVITGPNLLEDGKERTITVHFVYHRK